MKNLKNITKFFSQNLLKKKTNNFCQQQNQIKIVPEVEETIMNVIKMTAKCDQAKLNNKAKFEDLGFDSLDVVELIVAFEEHLGFDIDNEDAENNIGNVEDAIKVFSMKYSQVQLMKENQEEDN